MKVLCAMLAVVMIGCDRRSGSAPAREVVIYSSIDEPYLRPLVQRFEKESGIKVRVVTDTEATKSAALVQRLLAEKDRPQADVYWGNEIFHTINLAEQGCFAPYRPATAEDVPAKWRGANDLFTDIGLRARMIAVSTRPQVKDVVSKIRGVEDLTDPALKGKIGICNPAFGTASGHFAALAVVWGEERYMKFLNGVHGNEVKLLGGNSMVVDQIAAGTLAAGLTDNDDINNAKSEGQQIDGILPEGTLLIPSTIALVKDCPHPDAAKKLIEFLCAPAVEKELIDAKFFAYSVRYTTNVNAMDVDYVRCAHEMKKAVETALNALQERH